MKSPNRLEQGKRYFLSWSSKSDALYKLISWDHGGNCIVESSTGKRFQTETQSLRV